MEKPYKCDKCDKAYASKSSLTRHIKTKHSSNPVTYECDQCNYITKRPKTSRSKARPTECTKPECNSKPLYNDPRESQPMYCKKHAAPEMKNVTMRYKWCIVKDCFSRASYKNSGERPTHCIRHKTKDMKSINKTCAKEDCDTQPRFNLPGVKPGLYCRKHASPNMVDVYKIKCKGKDCSKEATFGLPGGERSHCKKHKSPNMIDLKNKRCAHTDCKKQPNYGKKGESPMLCIDHKSDDMVDLTHTICKVKDCIKRAYYSEPSQTKPVFCGEHKENNMKNHYDAVCEVKECSIQPKYGYVGDKPSRCSKHRISNMVNLKVKICNVKDCKTEATFGLPGMLSSRCSFHKSGKMVYRPRKKCISEDCKELAIYGHYENNFCENHMKPDMKNFVEKKCENCGLLYLLDENDVCQNCGKFLEKKVRLVKQDDVRQLFDSNQHEYISYDKSINTSCGRERPDFVFETLTHFVIVEVDENQHTSYDKKEVKKGIDCETARMINITQTLQAPTVFIRYNPDSYRSKEGKLKRIRKCIREKKLLEWLKYCLELPATESPKDTLRVVYLYYDEFDEGCTELKWIEMPI